MEALQAKSAQEEGFCGPGPRHCVGTGRFYLAAGSFEPGSSACEFEDFLQRAEQGRLQ